MVISLNRLLKICLAHQIFITVNLFFISNLRRDKVAVKLKTGFLPRVKQQIKKINWRKQKTRDSIIQEY